MGSRVLDFNICDIVHTKKDKMRIFIAILLVGYSSASMLVGGYRPQAMGQNGEWAQSFMEMATFATSELKTTTNYTVSVSEMKITNVETQVVSGMNYKLTLQYGSGNHMMICNVTIYDQPWTGTRQLTSKTCINPAKRSLLGGLSGGYRHINVTDKTVTDAASFAATYISSQNGNTVQTSHYSVVDAQVQVVSGLNIKMDIKFDNVQCEVVVYTQAWSNTIQVTSYKCPAPHRSLVKSGAVVGGVMPGGVTNTVADDNIQMLADMATHKVNAESNSMFTASQVSIDHVTKQVVAGMRYTFNLHLRISDCMKSEDNMVGHLTDCPLSGTQPPMPTDWHVEGLWQAWSDPKFSILSLTKM